jgi:hypothetical protein
MKESMHKGKKFFLWITGGIAALLIILLALSFLLPRLVDLNSIREKIKTGISQKIAGTVDYRKMEVTLFPRPRILINQARFSFPGTAEGTIDSLRIYPHILPLFWGKVRIGRIQIEAPHVSLTISERQKDRKKPPLSVQETEEKVFALLNTLASKVPGTRIGIEKGNVSISDTTRSLFLFQDIEGQIVLPPGEASITLTCSSNILKSMSLGIRLDPKNLKGMGTLKLTGMKPQPIVQHFFPDFVRRLGDSEANLMLSFKMLGLKDLQAEVQGSFPYLTFLNKNEKVPLKGVGIRAGLVLAGDKIEITLNELNLEHPRLTLGGSLVMDKTAQNVSMELSGSQVDVLSLRNVALSLAGELPVVQNIFAYVRGGKVPFITVRSQGASLEDLGKTESIFIKGLMQRGEIFVPGPQLGFKEVNGDCTISKGILDGKNVEGNLGNSQVRDGKLRVGLKGSDAPLHIDAAIKADLAEARNILRRLIKDETLLKEIDLISTLHGEAKGRLILGESTVFIKPRLELSEVSFTAEYQRIPFPLVIKGGQFSYDETRINVKKLGGTLGKSSFAELAGELRMGDAPSLEIPTGKIRIVQDEIYPWLKSFEGLKGSLKDLRSLRGAINLDTINLKGPLSKPKEWHFRLTGNMEDLAIDWATLPGPASLKKGAFEATEEKISLTDARTEILDASVALSGIQQGYLGGRQRTDLTFQGKMGPQSFGWAAKLAHLPSQFSLRDPVTFEHAHIAIEEGTTLFQGSLRVQKGPKITADVLKHSKGLAVNKLIIKDASSDAILSLDLQEKTLKLAFAGKLTSETLNKLIIERELPQGRIAGDFRAEIQREKPFQFTARGKIRGENIVIPSKWGIPIKIENLSLAGDGNSLAVEPSSLRLDDTPFSLKGNLNFTKGDLAIDMDLSADRIEWQKIAQVLKETGKKESKESNDSKESNESKETWGIPVKGTLRLKTNYFTYDKYTWTPLHADISFHRDDIDIAVTRAALCGISSPGTMNVTPKELSFDFQLTAENQELKPVLACLFGKDRDATGNFDLKMRIKGQGKKETILDSLQGDAEFLAKDGRIFRQPALLKMFSFLEVNQILRGFPEIRQEGFAYRSIKAKGELRQGKLEVKEVIVDGPSMKIASQGTVDLKKDTLDLTVLISPLNKTDFIIKKTPIIGSILGGSLVSIPLKVSGDMEDPKVSYHPVSAVGSGLLGIMERTIKAPVKLLDLFTPDEKK